MHAVHRLTPTIIEVVIRAPAAARAFQPGQFYRLQNFEVLAARDDEPGIGRTVLTMEGLAMTGAWADKEAGLVSASSRWRWAAVPTSAPCCRRASR